MQNKDNEAGIVHDGGLRPLLDLLDSKSGAVQHNAAFALYGLADNEVRRKASLVLKSYVCTIQLSAAMFSVDSTFSRFSSPVLLLRVMPLL